MQTASRIFHNALKMIRHILKCFRVLQYYQWCYKISSKSLIVIDSSWVQVEVSWRSGSFSRFIPFLLTSRGAPSGGGSPSWRCCVCRPRGGVLSRVIAYIIGCHWMSLDVIGCQWPLMVTTQKIVQNPSKSLKCCELLMPSDAQPIWHPHYFGRQAFHAGHCLSCIPTSAAMGWQNLQTFPKCVVYACSRSAWNCHNWSHFVALIDLIG